MFVTVLIQWLDTDDLKNLIEKEKSQIPQEVSALAIWKYQEIKCCFENPCGIKIDWKSIKLKILQSKLVFIFPFGFGIKL